MNSRAPGYMQVVRPAGQGFRPPIPPINLQGGLPSGGGGGGMGVAVIVATPPATFMVFGGIQDPDAAALGFTCDRAASMAHADLETAIMNYFKSQGASAEALRPAATSAQIVRLADLILYNCRVQQLQAQAGSFAGQISTLTGQVNSLTSQNGSLRNQVGSLSGQVSNLTNASAQKDQTISGLQTASSQKDQQIQSLQGQIAAIPPSQSAAAAQISDLQSRLTTAISKAGGVTPLGLGLGAAAGVAGAMLLRKNK